MPIDETVDTARSRKIEILLRVLSRLPVDQHAEVLAELCPEDAAVRRVVRSLLDGLSSRERPDPATELSVEASAGRGRPR